MRPSDGAEEPEEKQARQKQSGNKQQPKEFRL